MLAFPYQENASGCSKELTEDTREDNILAEDVRCYLWMSYRNAILQYEHE
jgi:hypothetical protein